jgi:hypothetical protein
MGKKRRQRNTTPQKANNSTIGDLVKVKGMNPQLLLFFLSEE